MCSSDLILEQVKPGSMIVRKSDTVPATSATPAASAKKGKAKKVSEPKDKELLGEGADEAATAAVPVTTTPLSGLSSDPSTLQKENALRLGR